MDAPKKKRKSYYNDRARLYAQRYNAETYDRIEFRIPKAGEMTKDDILAAAADAGESVNAYVTEAVRRRIESEKAK